MVLCGFNEEKTWSNGISWGYGDISESIKMTSLF